MSLPIYQGAQVPNSKPADANSGLWYNKFCNTWKPDFSGFAEQENGEDTGKMKWIAGMTNSVVGNRNLLFEAKERRRLLVNACKGHFITLNSNSVFVCGLGQSHPVENGFSWHHTLGVPYMPGSSIKGLVRSWTNWLKEDDPEINESEINRIFGPEGRGDKYAGSVIFLDAFPTSPVRLKVEIMNPHYDPWYQKGEAPGDWHDPNPIPFLAVEPMQSFSFAVMPAKPNNVEDCDKAVKWLIDALINSGAGAKTAVGFGRFDPPSDMPKHDSEEIWENVTLTYNRGNSTLTATGCDGRTASARNNQDKPIAADEIIARINKKKSLNARVVVLPAGGKAYRILKVSV